MDVALVKFLLVLLYIVLAVILLSISFGVPGNWILVGVAFVIALVTRFEHMTWGWLAVCVGLAILGEIIESLLGLVIVARRGGGRWGVLGSFVGGLVGVIVGAGFVPPIGSVVLGFVGAFAGAVAGEYARHRRTEHAVRVGFWSFVGRLAAIAGKTAVGCVILWIVVRTTW